MQPEIKIPKDYKLQKHISRNGIVFYQNKKYAVGIELNFDKNLYSISNHKTFKKLPEEEAISELSRFGLVNIKPNKQNFSHNISYFTDL